jgi:hypothetical protein
MPRGYDVFLASDVAAVGIEEVDEIATELLS